MSAIDEAEDRLFTSIMKHRDQIEWFKKYECSQSRNTIWVCKDGKELKLKDMSLGHLKNALNMLMRNHLNYKHKQAFNDAVILLKWEISYREEYPKIVEALEEEERTVDLCL